jgi:hypothetical protein
MDDKSVNGRGWPELRSFAHSPTSRARPELPKANVLTCCHYES